MTTPWVRVVVMTEAGAKEYSGVVVRATANDLVLYPEPGVMHEIDPRQITWFQISARGKVPKRLITWLMKETYKVEV